MKLKESIKNTVEYLDAEYHLLFDHDREPNKKNVTINTGHSLFNLTGAIAVGKSDIESDFSDIVFTFMTSFNTFAAIKRQVEVLAPDVKKYTELIKMNIEGNIIDKAIAGVGIYKTGKGIAQVALGYMNSESQLYAQGIENVLKGGLMLSYTHAIMVRKNNDDEHQDRINRRNKGREKIKSLFTPESNYSLG